jgi:hypothetical protein
MIRGMQILSVCALLSAGGILGLTASRWQQNDPQIVETLNGPSAVEMFKKNDNRVSDSSGERPPLVAQAEAFALLLHPQKSPEKPPALVLAGSPKPAMPPIRPMALSVNFKLRATSYYPHQPGKSMALISEVSSTEGSERWVKEGSRLGHFVIGEIHRGSITYRDGNQVREMTVEPAASLPNLVRDTRPGVRQVSAAVGASPLAAVDGNSIEIGGRQ